MRERSIGKLWRDARLDVSESSRKGIILMYHRVNDVGSDPWSLCVTPQHFAEHLDVLQKNVYPLRLQQLNKWMQTRGAPYQSVVITFDDGYVDNLHYAKPLLERYEIPATIFLATGYIRDKREFWWDKLERLLLQPGTLPETLRLSVNGIVHEWELGEVTHYSEDAYQRHRHWRAWEEAPSPRHSLYFSLWKLMHPLLESDRKILLDELLEWADIEPVSRASHRVVSSLEVLDLAQGDLIDIGSHTVTHASLAKLPADLQRDEIRHSKSYLEEILNRPVTSFAYPYGSKQDYTAETISIVRDVGFACACSTNAGIVGRQSDYFQLPRMHVQDWDGDEFSRQLSKWLDSGVVM